jgi:chemotaxis protein methyltransferase CheR
VSAPDLHPSAGAVRAAPTMGPAEFARFRALIYREAGIHLADCKQALLVGRLSRRLRELGLRSFGAYWRLVADGGDPAERRRMIEAVCTHETHFFRERHHWEFLAGELFPRWRAEAAERKRSRRVRAWSAGCSSGEEPYSLAMALLEGLPPSEGWSAEVVATDISTKVLARAETGLWPIDRKDEIPEAYLKRYMLRGRRSQEGMLAAGPALRRLIRFQPLNLNDAEYDLAGRFDLVFCRNVLIYFDDASRTAAVHRLLDRLEPGGHLFLGHAESLSRVTGRAKHVLPTIYTRSDEPAARAVS